MSNSIGNVVTKYTDILDEIVTAETLTSDLNMNQGLIGEYHGNGKIEIPKLSMDGLGNYNRSTGFVSGDVTLSWEEKTLAYDRGRSFSIDVMDDEERMMVVSMNLMSEFARGKVIPEVDAIRFARLAAAAGGSESAALSTAAATKTAVLEAEAAIEETGAKLTDCIFYITPTIKNLLREACERKWSNERDLETTIERFDGMKVVTVPQARFYTAVTVNDGTTEGQTAGGYAKNSSTGKNINFMLVNPAACSALAKHETLRYFDPETNQGANSHLWQYRLYHDLLTFDNKANLIYLHKSNS